jgi:predicted XRE-type DNA-binding protein
MTVMSTESFSDQLRRAISQSGLSQYAICKATGINKANLSRFMRGETGLEMANTDKIVAMLGLKLEARRRPQIKEHRR